MNQEVNLLHSLPHTERNIDVRLMAKSAAKVMIAKRFGREYFDGSRDTGYGGYVYDNRWQQVACDIVGHFNLKRGNRVLDIGCAKGYLVRELCYVMPGLEAFGIDVSEYAIRNCHPDAVGRLHLGSAEELPFPDRSFDAIVSINTLHNLDRDGVVQALKEIERVAPGMGFVQVDSYRTEEERERFMKWVLTAKFHTNPEGWLEVFKEAGYTGDYYWTVV